MIVVATVSAASIIKWDDNDVPHMISLVCAWNHIDSNNFQFTNYNFILQVSTYNIVLI